MDTMIAGPLLDTATEMLADVKAMGHAPDRWEITLGPDSMTLLAPWGGVVGLRELLGLPVIYPEMPGGPFERAVYLALFTDHGMQERTVYVD